MKKLYIIIVLAFIFRPVMPVVEYMVNYDYISTVLCENVDKPQLECNGKCHLAKELDKTLETKAPVHLEKATVLLDFIPVFTYKTELDFVDYSFKKDFEHSSYLNLYNYLYSSFVLQPPIV